MTIDDRLDRLTARHEALTQTVELIAAMQLKTEDRLQRAIAFGIEEDRRERERRREADEQLTRSLKESNEQWAARMADLDAGLQRMADALKRFLERGANGH